MIKPAESGAGLGDHAQAADANSMTVEATLAMIAKTADKDRRDHPAEYAAKK
jgi:hypothetical protein